jgi:hypothetical protein
MAFNFVGDFLAIGDYRRYGIGRKGLAVRRRLSSSLFHTQ